MAATRRKAVQSWRGSARLTVWRRALAPALALAVATAAAACGAAEAVPTTPVDTSWLRFGSGPRQRVHGEGVSLEVPTPFERVADSAFVVRKEGQVLALLRVEAVAPPPEGGVDSLLEARLATIRRAGVGGVVRDERVELGDLDGRLVEVVEVVGQVRGALMLLAVEAEAVLVVVSVAVPAEVHSREGGTLRTALASLRIAMPRR